MLKLDAMVLPTNTVGATISTNVPADAGRLTWIQRLVRTVSVLVGINRSLSRAQCQGEILECV